MATIIEERTTIIGSINALLSELESLSKDDVVNPFEYYRDLKVISDQVTMAVESSKPAALSYLSAMPKQELTSMGVEVRNGYAQYDFTPCLEWSSYKRAVDTLELKKKEVKSLEDYLKGIAKQQVKEMPNAVDAFLGNTSVTVEPEVVDEETGEIIPRPTIKGYTSGAITIKKM